MKRTSLFRRDDSISEKNKNSNFQKLDEVSGKYIAKKIFERFSNYNSQIDKTGSEELIKEAYKIMKKNYNISDQDSAEFIKCHNKENGKNFLSYEDIENACMKYIVGPKGYGISLLNDTYSNDKSKFFDLLFKEILQDSNSEFEMDKCRTLFEKYDRDGDGFLKKQDISLLLKDTYKEKDKKLDINDYNVEHYFSLLDKNQSNKVSYEEFEDYFVKAVKERNIEI